MMSRTLIISCIDAVLHQDVDEVKAHVTSYLKRPHTTASQLRGSLSKSVALNHVEITQFLLEQGVHNCDFPAEIAVRAKAFKVIELFIQKGWDMNTPLGKQEPPVLCVAFSTGDVQMSNWLLDHGADLNKRCDLDLTPLSHAMIGSPLAFIKTLFKERNADPIKGQLLHHAILRKAPDAQQLVRYLVQKGLPVDEIKYEHDKPSFDVRNVFGLGTPLHRAAELGKLAIVSDLLDAGANPCTLDTKGKKAIYWAESKNHRDVEEMLRKAEETCT